MPHRVHIGIGSNAEWDTRLDAALAAAVMGIQAVKGVEIGMGFGVVERRGSADLRACFSAAMERWSFRPFPGERPVVSLSFRVGSR